jgi:hypothetical protein
MSYIFKNTDLMTIYDAITSGTGSNTLLQTIIDRLTSTSIGTSVADSLQAEIGGTDYFLLETQVSSGKSTADWLTFIEQNTQNVATYNSTVRNPNLTSITGSLTISPQVHNLSVYNSGSAVGTINVNGGGAINIPAGVTVNFDAGGNNNRYPANAFVLNATGTTFIVSYTQ